MKIIHCDICWKEFDGYRRKSTVEMEQIMDAADLEDVCEECIESMETIKWHDEIVKIVAPKERGEHHE